MPSDSVIGNLFNKVGEKMDKVISTLERETSRTWPLKIGFFGSDDYLQFTITIQNDMSFTCSGPDAQYYSFQIYDFRQSDGVIVISKKTPSPTQTWGVIYTNGSENMNDWTLDKAEFTGTISFL